MKDDDGHEGQREPMTPIAVMLAAEQEHDLTTIRAVADQLDRTLPTGGGYAPIGTETAYI